MNVVKQDYSEKLGKLKYFYIGIIAVCVIAVIAAFAIQIKQGNDPSSIGGATRLPELTDDKISVYKQQFNEIFENKVNYLENNAYKITKIEEAEEIAYLGYQSKETKANSYELNVNIPYINIDDDVINKYNKQIKDIFEQKAKSVLNTRNNNVIYTVNYTAYVSINILSLVVRSTLKEGGKPQET